MGFTFEPLPFEAAGPGARGEIPVGTFVDFDQGLNAAVKKLRVAFGDVADEPIYIETISKRGYRFVASVAKTLEEVNAGQGPGAILNPTSL